MPQLVVEEVAQTAGCLELGHVGAVRNRVLGVHGSGTVLIKSGETSTPYISARKPSISRTVIPRAYSARILSSKPVTRRSCFAISRGSNVPSSMPSGPSSIRTVLLPVQLR
jgi:hypothetical protein